MRKAVAHRLVDAEHVELVEIRDVVLLLAVPRDNRVVQRAVPDLGRLLEVVWQIDVAQALGDLQVVPVEHAVHALAHRSEVLQLGVDEGTALNLAPGFCE